MTQKQQEQEFQRRYGQIVAKAWADPAFKARLLREVGTVLRENGLRVKGYRRNNSRTWRADLTSSPQAH